jgi:predicted nucleotidyltransferase
VTLGELRLRRADVVAVAGRHGASHLRVFGSVAREAPDDASDVDLLVDLEPGRTLLDLVALERDLAALLGCRVDVSTRLRPSLHRRIEHEVAEL